MEMLISKYLIFIYLMLHDPVRQLTASYTYLYYKYLIISIWMNYDLRSLKYYFIYKKLFFF